MLTYDNEVRGRLLGKAVGPVLDQLHPSLEAHVLRRQNVGLQQELKNEQKTVDGLLRIIDQQQQEYQCLQVALQRERQRNEDLANLVKKQTARITEYNQVLDDIYEINTLGGFFKRARTVARIDSFRNDE